MRETYRNLNNQNYWEKRWGNIKTDDPMINLNKYPLKYSLYSRNGNFRNRLYSVQNGVYF